MSDLIALIKKARESQVSYKNWKFTVRRPTDLEVQEMRGTTIREGDVMRRFVVGWSGITELDLIAGGTNLAVPFETELFMEWVADHTEVWPLLVGTALTLYEAHQKKVETELGEPQAG